MAEECILHKLLSELAKGPESLKNEGGLTVDEAFANLLD